MASVIEILPVGTLFLISVVKVYYLIFAVLTIMGGVMGYVKAKSIVSVVSGSISGVLLIVASFLLRERPIVGGVIALCVSVLLAGKFVPDFLHKKVFVPGGLMALLSLVGIVLTILALLPK